MVRYALRGAVGLALWLLFGAYVIGCGSGRVVQPSAGLQDPGPAPNSPANALRLLEWVYDNQAVDPYRRLLAGDFRLVCSATDSAGSQWRGTPWTRADELTFATWLFTDRSLRLTLDRNFFVFPDPNFADSDPDGRWHKSIRSTVTLVIGHKGGSSTEIQGHTTFSLVRGDLAVIPADLSQRGIGPDSTRWYLRRWEDETSTRCSIKFTE